MESWRDRPCLQSPFQTWIFYVSAWTGPSWGVLPWQWEKGDGSLVHSLPLSWLGSHQDQVNPGNNKTVNTEAVGNCGSPWCGETGVVLVVFWTEVWRECLPGSRRWTSSHGPAELHGLHCPGGSERTQRGQRVWATPSPWNALTVTICTIRMSQLTVI